MGERERERGITYLDDKKQKRRKVARLSGSSAFEKDAGKEFGM